MEDKKQIIESLIKAGHINLDQALILLDKVVVMHPVPFVPFDDLYPYPPISSPWWEVIPNTCYSTN